MTDGKIQIVAQTAHLAHLTLEGLTMFANLFRLSDDVWQNLLKLLAAAGALCIISVLVWQGYNSNGVPDPAVPHLGYGAAILDTAVLVFREGLECILVLATVIAGFSGARSVFLKPVATGAGIGMLVTVVTWFVAVGILTDLGQNTTALDLQVYTGGVAIVGLLLIMCWFSHKFYWTGWMSNHGRRKQALLKESDALPVGALSGSVFLGMVLLGFTSVYREGFELVLFLQGLRLQVGTAIVMQGALVGLFFISIVGALTLYAHKRLPHRKMLIVTGILLGAVLLVMVGEQAQEMQQASFLASTDLALPIPKWAGTWLSVFPNVQTLIAQAIAAIFLLGCYFGGEALKKSRVLVRR